MVKNILRIESLIFLILSLVFFHWNTNGESWLIFLLLLFTPDISMVGYTVDKEVGAFFYNAVHSYILVFVFIILGNIIKVDWLVTFGIILSAHVSLDRLLGFGLKYSTDFKDTHMQKV